jgi:hypothetical protein
VKTCMWVNLRDIKRMERRQVELAGVGRETIFGLLAKERLA